MDALDRICTKAALATLRAAGGTGLSRPALLDAIGGAAAGGDDDSRREAAFSMLLDRGWMDWHMEPVWHERRYTITERGMTALEGM